MEMEVSYSSTLIMCWAALLAVMSWVASRPLQGLTILVLSTIALTSPHGESRMLLPMLFLAESLLDDVVSPGRLPIHFYASTLLSYLTLVVSRSARLKKVDRNTYPGAFLYIVVGVVVMYFNCADCVFSFGAAAFVLFGLLFFLALLPVLGENEAVLVGSLVGFHIYDMVTNKCADRDEALLQASGVVASKTHIVGRGAVMSAITMVAVLYLGSRCCMVPRVNISKSSERVISVSRITLLFWSSLVCVVAVMYAVVSSQLGENVLRWVVEYLILNRYRLWILIMWGITIPLSVIVVDKFAVDLRKTARRKMFHFIAVFVFTPVALVDPYFLSLSLSLAVTIGMIVELSRFYGVYGSSAINEFMLRHIDDRESIKGAIRTHIYLIYGLGFSMMLRYRHEQPESVAELSRWMELSINIIPGIVALGIVDACAGIVGSTFLLSYRRALGRYLSNCFFTEKANTSITHKTTTGTVGGLVCGVLFWFLVLLFGGTMKDVAAGQSFILILICSLTECFIEGIDNLQLPLVVDGAAHTLFALWFYGKNG
ncbi:putative dolichol kinase [Trypanosoma rangeli]|uniref:dolichol kinase n=1 Tax=Trypanosoma rangeli TaxID=5698 RepID=A0A3R7KY54_TRYRA|nr:putative dolichol kinase [Trypanosoma rangeli]RNF12024.1 putative dolichol kinase [Trypanosoma rangeli]|eukprot:RNF12024.1 putative dolichol kinase [Trypanosoma rangeli]